MSEYNIGVVPRMSAENARMAIAHLESTVRAMDAANANRRRAVYGALDEAIENRDKRAYDVAIVHWVVAVCEVSGSEASAVVIREGIEKLKSDLRSAGEATP